MKQRIELCLLYVRESWTKSDLMNDINHTFSFIPLQYRCPCTKKSLNQNTTTPYSLCFIYLFIYLFTQTETGEK